MTFSRAAGAGLLAAAVSSLAAPVMARPVSYPEAWTVMVWNEAERNTMLLHYTTDPRTSFGFRVEHREYDDHTFVGGQMNRLLKRWNAPASQGNLYLKTGVGVATGDFNTTENDSRLAGFARLSADWEDRRWFVSGDVAAYAMEGEVTTEQSARLGVAPYVADAGALHTWLMVQVDHRPDAPTLQGAEETTVTPLVRFFKGNSLLEVGYSSNDEPLLNFIYRF